MKNILMILEWDRFSKLAGQIQIRTPDIEPSSNFEQVLAMVKQKEVARICVVMGSWMETGDVIAEKVHEIDPGIPILVWDWDPKRLAPNEIYLESKDYEATQFFEINADFFAGKELTDIKLNTKVQGD